MTLMPKTAQKGEVKIQTVWKKAAMGSKNPS
jgi:hypothetical protein